MTQMDGGRHRNHVRRPKVLDAQFLVVEADAIRAAAQQAGLPTRTWIRETLVARAIELLPPQQALDGAFDPLHEIVLEMEPIGAAPSDTPP